MSDGPKRKREIILIDTIIPTKASVHSKRKLDQIASNAQEKEQAHSKRKIEPVITKTEISTSIIPKDVAIEKNSLGGEKEDGKKGIESLLDIAIQNIHPA